MMKKTKFKYFGKTIVSNCIETYEEAEKWKAHIRYTYSKEDLFNGEPLVFKHRSDEDLLFHVWFENDLIHIKEC